MQRWNRSVWALGVALVLSVTAAWGCSDDEVAGSTACASDIDCAFGTICAFEEGATQTTCITTDDCDFCGPDQVCVKTAEDPEGHCSVPECAQDADCAGKPGTTCQEGLCSAGGSSACTSNADCDQAAGETCNLAGECEAPAACANHDECGEGKICEESVCVDGCADSKPCPNGDICNAEGQCETPETCTEGSCPSGEVCDTATSQCVAITSCDQVDCPVGEFCNTNTLVCEQGCTADSCEQGKVCNTQTGQCVTDNCVGDDPNQCTGSRSMWDPVNCFCAECLSDTDCDQAAGETCNSGGSCFACDNPCDSGAPSSSCGGATPYCRNDCCVECVGAADCSGGQLCLDGFCGDPPNCNEPGTECPTGYTCDTATGSCQPPATNQSCDPQDPTGCPQGTFCMPDPNDQTQATCQSPGGGLGCGLCNADCTCPNGACNGFLCECSTPLSSSECPDGQTCAAPLLPLCVPFSL